MHVGGEQLDNSTMKMDELDYTTLTACLVKTKLFELILT